MRKCPECKGVRLTWDAHYSTTIPLVGSRTMSPALVLGCDECSATVWEVDLKTAADMLNTLGVTA